MTEVASRSQHLLLIVEDSDDVYELFSDILAGEGYAIEGASSGDDAYRRAVELRPNVIIMDYQLRGLDGCDATRLIKADPRTAHIPVLMLTGYVGRQQVERARLAGCDAILLKPCHIDELLSVIRRIDAEAANAVAAAR